MPLFETQVELACSPETAFDFLIRPANVAALNPPEMNFTLLDGPESIEDGSQIRFQIEAMGYKQEMLHEIIELERPKGFLVRELEGVLKKFEHVHRLEAHAQGTILIESITFEPPGGVVGFVLNESKIRNGFEKNFAHRHRELKSRLDQA